MSGFHEGDVVSAVDAYGRPVSGVAMTGGLGGYVTIQPADRPEGAGWVTPPAVMVRARDCSLVERHASRLATQGLRDQKHAGRQATWAVEQRLRERSRD